MSPEDQQPPVLQAVPVQTGEAEQETPSRETISEPGKLLRIASMVRELLDETRQASLDESGRKRLAEIYSRSLGELGDVISGDLRKELEELAPPLEGVPTESEIRIAQAQLVGWLEGLFHGIQATLFAQQLAARQQLEQIRQLPPGLQPGMVGQPGQPPQPGTPDRPGTYL